MRLVKDSESAECLGSGLIRDFVLDQAVGRDFCEYMSNFGRVDLQEGDNAFFTVDVEYLFTMKGILSDNMLKIIYRKERADAASELVKKMILLYGDDGKMPDLLKQQDTAIKA